MPNIIKNILYGIVIFVIIGLGIKAIIFINHINYSAPEQNINGLASLTTEAVTPWWVPIIQKLAGWGIIGAILIIGLVYFLKKYPETQ